MCVITIQMILSEIIILKGPMSTFAMITGMSYKNLTKLLSFENPSFVRHNVNHNLRGIKTNILEGIRMLFDVGE